VLLTVKIIALLRKYRRKRLENLEIFEQKFAKDAKRSLVTSLLAPLPPCFNRIDLMGVARQSPRYVLRVLGDLCG
jgi:hypothetical protein